MGRENKKDAVAALHREQILKAAEKLFSEKGYVQTTIDDISKASAYSRRTIYAYYENKEDILHHIMEKGLLALKTDIENAVNRQGDFMEGYREICMAMRNYQREYPHSADTIKVADTSHIGVFNNFDTSDVSHTSKVTNDSNPSDISDTVKHILCLGEEINGLLASFIEKGKEKGIVRKEVVPLLTVYILWSGITALLTLADTKGTYICRQFNISENEFLDYGFQQLINSILEVRV
ncbi:MAG: TetR/AcrR family transcriptional regulator [Lachnospiraceae bacterium]